MNTKEKRTKAKSLSEELTSLNKEIEEETKRCGHEWEPAVYDAEEYLDATYSHLEGVGSNPIYNYHTATRPRWRRDCKKCGVSEYTKTQKPVAFTPDFGN